MLVCFERDSTGLGEVLVQTIESKKRKEEMANERANIYNAVGRTNAFTDEWRGLGNKLNKDWCSLFSLTRSMYSERTAGVHDNREQ